MSYDHWKQTEPDTQVARDPRSRCEQCGARCHPKDRLCSSCEYDNYAEQDQKDVYNG